MGVPIVKEHTVSVLITAALPADQGVCLFPLCRCHAVKGTVLPALYDAGYSPICPMLYLPLFLNDAVPEEHKSGIDMGRDLLRRSRVLVVCGSYVNVAVKNDIAVAQRLGITATTLDGILTVKGQRRR